jgi:hypothetical protein
MEATITVREGCPDDVAKTIAASTPVLDPHHWLTRREAADKLRVNPRTIDRYIRRRVLSAYSGPVSDRSGSHPGHGVRVWRDDVIFFHSGVSVKVVR